MKNFVKSSRGRSQGVPKIFRASMWGALRGHLCDSTLSIAFLLQNTNAITKCFQRNVLRKPTFYLLIYLLLHWLRIPQRIQYKLCILVGLYRRLHGSSPGYLQSSIIPVSDTASRRRLRSASSGDLVVPAMRRFHYITLHYLLTYFKCGVVDCHRLFTARLSACRLRQF